MGVVKPIGGIGRHSIGKIRAKDVGSYAVEDEVTNGVGNEMNTAVAREVGELDVCAIDRALERGHPIVVLLKLVLIKQRGVEAGDPEGGEVWRQTGCVRYLESRIRSAAKTVNRV